MVGEPIFHSFDKIRAVEVEGTIGDRSRQTKFAMQFFVSNLGDDVTVNVVRLPFCDNLRVSVDR